MASPDVEERAEDGLEAFSWVNGEPQLEKKKLLELFSTRLEKLSLPKVSEILSLLIGVLKQNCLLNNDKFDGLLAEVVHLHSVFADESLVLQFLKEMLRHLMTHSISVREGLLFLDLIRETKESKERADLLSMLLEVHQRQRNRPTSYFSFPGTPGSVLTLPPFSKRFPSSSGWSFCCWFRYEQRRAEEEHRQPYLFYFRSASGLGYSAHFTGHCLVLTSMKVKGKGFQFCVPFEFKPMTWFHLAVIFVHNKWRRSEVQVYVDGQLKGRNEMLWFVSTTETLDKCFIGGDVTRSPTLHLFSGQIASIYLFSEPLKVVQVCGLHRLGPDYRGQFVHANENILRAPLPPNLKKSLYESKLNNALVCSYLPTAVVSETLCLQMAQNSLAFKSGGHAALVGEARTITTSSLCWTMEAMGGVHLALLPLMDWCVREGDSTCFVLLFELMTELIADAPFWFGNQVISNQTFLIVSRLLLSTPSSASSTCKHQQVSSCFLNERLLTIVISFTRTLLNAILGGGSGPDDVFVLVLKQLLDHILLNCSLWCESLSEQEALLAFMSTEFLGLLSTTNEFYACVFNELRRVSTVIQLLFAVKTHYSIHSKLSAAACNKYLGVRGRLLDFIKELVIRGGGIHPDELEALLNFLSTGSEEEIVDVLRLVNELMQEEPASLVPAFDAKNGVKVIFKLLHAKDEEIRVDALRLLSSFLARSTAKRKADVMGPQNLFMLIQESLSVFLPLSHATYVVLFEMLTETSYEDFRRGDGGERRIENPLLLKVIATLLAQSDHQLRLIFLADLQTLLNGNQRENRRLVLQMSVWQHWLVSLIPSKGGADIRANVLLLFQLLLHHAIKHEFGGWRVWIDSLAIIHTKEARDEFLSQYQQQSSNQSQLTIAVNNNNTSSNNDQVSISQSIASVEKQQQEEEAEEDSEDGEDEEEKGAEVDAAPCRRGRKKIVTNFENGQTEEQSEEVKETKTSSSTSTASTIRVSSATGNKQSVFPAFRIPEFRWSASHLQILDALLNEIEVDVDQWKQQTLQGAAGSSSAVNIVTSSSPSIDLRSGVKGGIVDGGAESEENSVYIVNCIHLVSQLADNIVIAVGGLLPLLAWATGGQPQQEKASDEGLQEEEAERLLFRLVSLVDLLCFALSAHISFLDLEAEKNMASGGILRQVLRLVATVAVKNALKRKQSQHQVETAANEERLLQEIDVNRLRACIYRDCEGDAKQSQFLALSTLYFVSVLAVSEYRDQIEPKDQPTTINNNNNNDHQQQADVNDNNEEETTEEGKEKVKAEAEIVAPTVNKKQIVNGEELSARLERSLSAVCPLLRELVSDFSAFLSKTLRGSHGQELLTKEALRTLRNASSVESVMLLCSQEWQNSLQKNAGLAFIELINEGRLLSHSMKDHIVRVANEAEFILNRLRADDITKHEHFTASCVEQQTLRAAEEKMIRSLISGARKRDEMLFTRFREQLTPADEFRLDSWEDDCRRRRRFIRTSQQQQILSTIAPGAATTASDSNARKTDEDEAEIDVEQQQQQHTQQATEASAFSVEASLVWLLFELEGRLQVTANELIFEICEKTSPPLPSPAILRFCPFLNAKISFSEIRAIFARKRFLPEVNAVEIFLSQRTSILLQFADSSIVKKLIKLLPPVGIGVKYGIEQNRCSSLMSPRELFKSSNMTNKWIKREISNFEYLMFLNTIAGRNFQDLSNYPIFPWILSDYDSPEIDLTQLENYRDLTKTLNNLNHSSNCQSTPADSANSISNGNSNSNGNVVNGEKPEEEKETKEQEQENRKQNYSSPQFVVSLLSTLKPFSLLLEHCDIGAVGGFDSIASLWSKVISVSFKELIPEFFYLPEIFTGLKPIGQVQSDKQLNRFITLPEWCGNSAENFVRINALALESELVSSSIHSWIDLIFGFKQRGPEAVKAKNFFFGEKKENFGSVPAQLTVEPHPPRNPPTTASSLTLAPNSNQPMQMHHHHHAHHTHHLHSQEEMLQLVKFPFNASINFISTINSLLSSTLITMNSSQQFHLHKWNAKEARAPFALDTQSGELDSSSSSSNQIIELIDDCTVKQSFVTSIDCKHIILSPFYDNSFRVYSTETGKLTQVIYGHNHLVTSLVRSEYNINGDFFLVSASKDCTLLLWIWNQSQSKVEGNFFNFNFYVLPKLIISGHLDPVSSVVISSELGLLVSASANRILLHTTNDGNLITSIEEEKDCAVSNVVLSRQLAYIIGIAKQQQTGRSFLFSFNLRGNLMKRLELKENQVRREEQLLNLTRDGEFLILNETNNSVKIIKCFDLSPLYVLNTKDSIKSFSLIDHKYLLVGTENGKIHVYSVDFSRWQFSADR